MSDIKHSRTLRRLIACFALICAATLAVAAFSAAHPRDASPRALTGPTPQGNGPVARHHARPAYMQRSALSGITGGGPQPAAIKAAAASVLVSGAAGRAHGGSGHLTGRSSLYRARRPGLGPDAARTASVTAPSAGTAGLGGDDRLSTSRTDWWTYTGITASQVNSLLSSNNARLTGIQVDSASNPVTFTVSMVANAGAYLARSWWYYGISTDQAVSLLKANAARPISVQRYWNGSTWLVAIVMVDNSGLVSQPWAWWSGDSEFLSGKVAGGNWRITRLRQYYNNNGHRFFDAIMVPNSGSAPVQWWWYYGVPASAVSQRAHDSNARLLDIQGNGDGTFNIVLVRSGSGWSTWWDQQDLAALVSKAVRLDSRLASVYRYTDAAGATRVVATMAENNPDQAGMRSDVLRQSLNAYAADSAAGGMLEYRESGIGTITQSFGSGGAAEEDRVGSISKTFVAVSLLKLVAQGKVGLDDTVEHWLPGLVPDGSGITVQMLLNHTSGLHNYTADQPFTAVNMKDSYTPGQLIAAAVRHAPYFAPGQGYQYSNTNYVLLALIIEKATGQYYGDVIKQDIIDPLGLTSTFVPRDTAMPDPRLRGYWNDGAAVIDTTLQNATHWYGPGAIVSTVANVNSFYQALLQGRLLPPAQLSQMKQTLVRIGTGPASYGLGIVKMTLPCGTTIWYHNGYVPGFETFSAHTEDGNRNITWAYDAPGGPDSSLDSDLLYAAFCRF